ncbi:sucrase ferredoxin [Parasphingorhabdus pacifica]
MHATPTGSTSDLATCSALAREWAEPRPGTAAVASTWLCLEQPGPWGSDALLRSHLDPAVGQALADRAARSGVRVQLIRRTGKHPDTGTAAPRRVYLAHTHPERCWLRGWEVTDATELLALDFDRIAQGEHDDLGVPVHDPLLLVCTNGRRDRCCAIRGRLLLDELGDRHGESVWETTHTGGHRFAPATVLLPSGFTYGQMTAPSADAALSAAASGKVSIEHCRGRSTWSPRGQSAELAVREHVGEPLVDALRIENEAGDRVLLAHQDGRRWLVTVQERRLEPPRPNSCGKEPADQSAFVVTHVVKVPE